MTSLNRGATRDAYGDLTNVVYSDGVTPNVTNSFDRLGRLGSVSWTNITDTMTYNLANELQVESFSGGVLNGLSVTNGFDTYLRRTNLTAQASGVLSRTAYGYDAASRLSTVSDGTNNATYTYLANSPLVSQILFKSNSVTRMTTTKSYDYLNRLTQVSSAPSASYILSLVFNYTYNAANQRTHNTLADGSYWIYGYDSLGQVTNACKYFADGTPVAGQQFDYTFDTIGNRTQTLSGDTNGTSLHTANYYANDLNQVTNRDVPAYVDILGASILTNAVSVNGGTAYRKQEYFWRELGVNNSSSALWTNIIVSGGQSVTGNVYVAKEPEVFKYDADGNLTNDGRWAYTWDGENRLVGMTNNTSVGPNYKLTFAYDYQGRRIQKMVSTNSVGIYTNRFLYDGWNLVAELNPASSLVRSYMWGTDLSGSQQGAGGVGGLLEVSYYGASTTNCFPAYDGNGNVAGLINAADGTIAANYEYGPFGEPIRITGAMANNSPFLFSTKYYDSESGLYYYGCCFYNPSTGTWPNRDPLQEVGGANLYAFLGNDAISTIDSLGCLEYRFHVVVGIDDSWSSPAYAGTGTYSTGSNFAKTSVFLCNMPPPWWWPLPISAYCNTVWSSGDSSAAHAGEIDVYAKDPCGGTFTISGEYSADIFGDGPKGGYGHAWLYSATGTTLSHIVATPRDPTASDSVSISENITLAPNKEKLVLRFVPFLDTVPGPFTFITVNGSITLNN